MILHCNPLQTNLKQIWDFNRYSSFELLKIIQSFQTRSIFFWFLYIPSMHIKFFLFLLIPGLLVFLISCERERNAGLTESEPTIVSDSWKSVKSLGHGDIVLYYVPSEGFAYYDENGELIGVTADIFKDFTAWVTEHYGFPLNIQQVPMESWTEFYRTVENATSGTFGMGNVTITDERKQSIGFSPPYMTNIAVLITHNSVRELRNLENIGQEFRNLKGLAFQGTLHEARVKALKEHYFNRVNIEYAHSNGEIIQKVSSLNSHFAYIDVYNYWRAKLEGKPVKRHPSADFSSEQFGYIMPHGSDWEPIITEFFNENDGYLQSARYRAIMRTHLGEGLATLLMD